MRRNAPFDDTVHGLCVGRSHATGKPAVSGEAVLVTVGSDRLDPVKTICERGIAGAGHRRGQ